MGCGATEQTRVESEDTDVVAVEAADEHVRFWGEVVEGYGGDDINGDTIFGVDDSPGDLIDVQVVGRDPAADDTVAAFMAGDVVGLAEGLVADDAGDDASGGVFGEPADTENDGGAGDIEAFEPEEVAGQFEGHGGAGAADEVLDGRVVRWTGRAAVSGAGTGA